MKKGKHQNRQYQTDIENAVIDYLFEKPGNPIVAAPGGVGKSYCMARLTKRFVTEWPGTTVINLAQDAKLLDQNCNELLRYWPTAPCGIYSAGLNQRDTMSPIIFAGIQSVAKRGAEFGKRHIVLVDEADLISPKEDALYHQFIKALKHANPFLRMVGFTASPFRMGTGCLTNLDFWDDICIDLTRTEKFNWFIDNGFLCPLINKRGAKEVDITNIAMKGGEFDEKELQIATDTDELNKAVVEETIRYGIDRKHWLIFSAGVKHGHNLAKLFNARGVATEMLSGKDTMEHRAKIEAKWRAGEVRALVNCGLYGRGFDFPAIDLIVWARATQSPALWLQGCVRGTRTYPGKENALVLDMAGNTRRLGPVNNIIVPQPRRKGDGEKGEAPIKECPQCHSYVPIQCKECPDCGFIFPPPKTLEKKATDAEILARTKEAEPIIEDFRVRSVRYKPRLSKKNNYYLLVTYGVGTAKFDEFLYFDSSNGMVQRKNKNWWLHRGGKLPIPTGTDEAADRANKELNIPTIVTVDISKRYPDVLGCTFDPDAKLHDDEIDDDDIPF